MHTFEKSPLRNACSNPLYIVRGIRRHCLLSLRCRKVARNVDQKGVFSFSVSAWSDLIWSRNIITSNTASTPLAAKKSKTKSSWKTEECWKNDGKLLAAVTALTWCLALCGIFWQLPQIPLQCKGHFCINKRAWSTFTSSAYSCALANPPGSAAAGLLWQPPVHGRRGWRLALPGRPRATAMGAGQKQLPPSGAIRRL